MDKKELAEFFADDKRKLRYIHPNRGRGYDLNMGWIKKAKKIVFNVIDKPMTIDDVMSALEIKDISGNFGPDEMGCNIIYRNIANVLGDLRCDGKIGFDAEAEPSPYKILDKYKNVVREGMGVAYRTNPSTKYFPKNYFKEN